MSTEQTKDKNTVFFLLLVFFLFIEKKTAAEIFSYLRYSLSMRSMFAFFTDLEKRKCLPIVQADLKWVSNAFSSNNSNGLNRIRLFPVILTGNSYPELAENISR